MENDYDVIIVGAGVIGSAMLYTLANHTKIKRILLIEKYAAPAQLNSNSRSNSQTLHMGDIETNYSARKIAETKAASEMILKYVGGLEKREREKIISKCGKMLLGVGADEAEFIKKRYDTVLKKTFPGLKQLERGGIAKLEPYVVEERDPSDELFGIYSESGYMVDYGALSNSFIKHSRPTSGRRIDVSFKNELKKAERTKDGFKITTTKGIYRTSCIVFASGNHTPIHSPIIPQLS